MSRWDALVIGAGPNGLVCAGLLAKAGRRTLVVERRPVVGGLAAAEEFHPGYRTCGPLHDTGGLRPGVVAELDLERHGLERLPGPRPVLFPRCDGPGLLLHHGAEEAAGEIDEHCPADVAAYREYRALFDRLGRLLAGVLSGPPPGGNGGAGRLLRLAGSGVALRFGRDDPLELLRMGGMPVADWLDERFESDLLKGGLAHSAVHGTFLGPRSPGSQANLVRAEVTAGRPARRGPQAVVDALEAAALGHGAEIRTEAEVERIRVSGGKVEGVRLVGGEECDARVVAASCDPRTTFLRLLEGPALGEKLRRRIGAFRARGTTATVDLALDAPLRFGCRYDLACEHARTGESLDDLERAFDAVKYGTFSDRPVLDVHVPTVANPEWAPEGGCAVSIAAHFAPHDLAGGWTDERRHELGDTVVAALERFVPGLRDTIVARRVRTPADIEDVYGVWGGHIHHGEHALDQLLVRPSPECMHYRTPIGGLYLCGSGTHPGGGLTGAPGALGATTILEGENGK